MGVCPPIPLLVVAICVLSCSPTKGAWRDQLIFIGDEGTVMPLVAQRDARGNAELKAWLGVGGRWQSAFFRRIGIRRGDARSLGDTLTAFGRRGGGGARVTFAQEGGEVRLGLRTPQRSFELVARGLTSLGQAIDPEGASTYQVGAATLRQGRVREDGWLVLERTPSERPRNELVEYGDFAFVVVRHGEEILCLKASTIDAFDVGFARGPGGTRRLRGVSVERLDGALALRYDGAGLPEPISIADTTTAGGRSPSGAPVRYETLLLTGSATGVAFAIGPRRERGRR